MSARARVLTGLILLGISIALFSVAMLRALVGDWDMDFNLPFFHLASLYYSGFGVYKPYVDGGF